MSADDTGPIRPSSERVDNDNRWALRPRPRPTPFTEPFWRASADGRLVVQRCSACGHWRWPPQLACPECLSEAGEWITTAGTGTVYSYSVVHRGVVRRIEKGGSDR